MYWKNRTGSLKIMEKTGAQKLAEKKSGPLEEERK
jgi:hypothetical protein